MGWGSIQIRALTGLVAAAVFTAGATVPGAFAAAWLSDAKNGCATSNPFPNPNETIRWLGNCAQGKLDGRGTLIWYRDGVETERNDGSFRAGELDGYAVTRYPDGNVVHGRYRQGQRHGSFMTIRSTGEYVAATYEDGRLVSQRHLGADEIAAWKQKGGPQQIETPPPSSEPVAAVAASAGEEPVSGRTAIASPSRMLPAPAKPAASPGKALSAAPQAPASGARTPMNKPAGNFTLGTQVAEAVVPAESSQPTPILPATPQPGSSSLPQPGASAAPSLPAPSMQPAPPRPVLTQASQTPPQPVATEGPVQGTPTATTARRPPWMVTGAPDPVAFGPAAPGNTPPQRSVASVPQQIAQPQYPPALPPAAAVAPQAYAADDASPTEASRRYLAAREGAAAPQAPTPQMAALPSYRALQPASPYAPLVALPQTVIATGPTTMPPVVMPDGGVYAAGGPEGLFKQGYQLEMSGRFREAEQVYERIIVSYSNSQTAMLANERLNGLRRFTRETGVRIADSGPQSQVTVVNEPRNWRANEPQQPALPAMPSVQQPTRPQATSGMGAGVSAGESSGGMAQNLTGMTVCTQQGLYDKEARWCGIVRADDGRRLSVEIRDVILPRFGSWSIEASTCTGGNSVNWFSKGTMVRVPRACMEMKG